MIEATKELKVMVNEDDIMFYSQQARNEALEDIINLIEASRSTGE